MILIGDMRRYPRRMGYTSRACEYAALEADRLPDFLPSSLPNLAAWYRADQGITLGTTPLAAGTVPPAVTISGTLTQSLGLYIQIDGAGTLGIATFKWSINNGSTFVATAVLTAASVVLGATGITAAFPAGTYLTDNIYRATGAQRNDLSGNGRHLVQAVVTKQPLFAVAGGSNNQATDTFDGVDDFQSVAFALPKPVTLIMVMKYTTAFAAPEDPVDGISVQTMRLYRGASTQVHQVGDGAGVKDRVNSGFTPESWHFVTSYLDSSTSSYVDEDLVNKIAPGDSGTAAAGGITLGAFGGGIANWAHLATSEIIVYGRALSVAEKAQVNGYLKLRYTL